MVMSTTPAVSFTPEMLTASLRAVCDPDVRAVGLAALLAEANLAASALTLPRDLGVVLLDLVEQNDESDALDGGLELVVRGGNVTLEVTLDDLSRPLRGLLCVRRRVQGRELRRQVRRPRERSGCACCLNLFAGTVLLSLLV